MEKNLSNSQEEFQRNEKSLFTPSKHIVLKRNSVETDQTYQIDDFNKNFSIDDRFNDDDFSREMYQFEMQIKPNSNLTSQGDLNIQSDSSKTDGIKSHMNNDKQSTELQAFANLFKGFIGAGIMGLPYAYFQVGWLLGAVIIFLTITNVYYSTILMLQIAEDFEKPKVGYYEVWNYSLGSKSVIAYKFFITILQGGCCVAYVIFFTQFFEIAFETTDSPKHRLFFLMFSCIVIIPMSFINDYHFFHKFSVLGNILSIVTLIAILQLSFSEISQNFNSNIVDVANFSAMPGFMGISLFSMEVIGQIFPVKNSMKQPEKFNSIFFKVCLAVGILLIFFCTVTSICMGNEINQIVLFGLQKKQSYFLFFQSLYAINLCLTYPLQLFPVVLVIDSIPCVKKNFTKNSNYWILKYVPRFIATLIIFFVAFFVPKFSTFLNLMGAFAGTVLQFVFPILGNYFCFRQKLTKKEKIQMFSALSFGIISGAASFYYSCQELAKE